MSDSAPKSDPAPKKEPSAAAPRKPADSRAGFVTMPTELRAFQKEDPHAGALAEADVAAAAAKLREAGRGSDVLFEDLRAEPPRAPSPDDNRAEHLVIEMPNGASPWALAGVTAEGTPEDPIDKRALPSSTAPLSQPPPSVTERPVPATSARTNGKPSGRRWVGVAVGICVLAGMAFAVLRGSEEPTASGGAAETTAPLLASAPPMTTGAEVATGAAASTGAAPIGTGELPTASTALPSTTGAQAPTSATGVRPVPKPTAEPSADAGALPRPPASVEPTSAPVVTGVPSASTAPSAKPSATSSSPFDVIYENKNKKESGHQ